VVPLRRQVGPPIRHRLVTDRTPPPLVTLGATGVALTPVFTGGKVGCVASMTHPAMLRAAVAGHRVGGGGVVGVPLPRQPGVSGHGLALAESASPAVAEGTDEPVGRFGQILDGSAPLVHPAAAVGTPRAAQPNLALAPKGEVRRSIVLVEVWVPRVLDEVVLRVGQGFLAPGIETRRACNRGKLGGDLQRASRYVSALQSPWLCGVCRMHAALSWLCMMGRPTSVNQVVNRI